MGRKPRWDGPGAMHHVSSRGVARRSIFDDGVDARNFLSRLARAARRGRLRVLAFALLMNHYHLLARSVNGELSRAMEWVLRGHTKWFNWRHGRDGPLFRGRFFSRRVADGADFRNVVRYIDHNPVEAGLCAAPADYRHGSAFQYARLRGPVWLDRAEIEAWVRAASGGGIYDGRAYSDVFGRPLDEGERWLCERRLRQRSDPSDPLAACLEAAELRERMRAAATHADGPQGDRPALVAPQRVLAVAAERQRAFPDWPIVLGPRPTDGWSQAKAGALQALSGLTRRESAARLGVSERTVNRLIERHAELLARDELYAARCEDLFRAVLASASAE